MCFLYLLTRSMWTLSEVTTMLPPKWHRIISTKVDCQTNISLIKDFLHAHVRITGIITQASFETIMLYSQIQWAN